MPKTTILSFQNLSDIAEEIDLYGRHSKYDEVLFDNDKEACSAFFTALATLMDACDVIDQYTQIEKESTLTLYGLLQAIYMQQDSCYDLNKIFNIQNSKDVTIEEIRKIRNELVGHPLSSHYHSHNFLGYYPWDKWHFTYASYVPEFTLKEVNIKELLREHYKYVETNLNKIHLHVKQLCESVPDNSESDFDIIPKSLDEELREKMKACEETERRGRDTKIVINKIVGRNKRTIIKTTTHFKNQTK